MGGERGARRLVAMGNTNTPKRISDLVRLLTLAVVSLLVLDFIVVSDMKQEDGAWRTCLII